MIDSALCKLVSSFSRFILSIFARLVIRTFGGEGVGVDKVTIDSASVFGCAANVLDRVPIAAVGVGVAKSAFFGAEDVCGLGIVTGPYKDIIIQL